MLVTHQVSITGLTGADPQLGENVVAERTMDGLSVAGAIRIGL